MSELIAQLRGRADFLDDSPRDTDTAKSAALYREAATALEAARADGGCDPQYAGVDDLVARFSVALRDKLRAAQNKYGHDDAWKRDDWRDSLVEQLSRHLFKGDPRDVAAYCAFAWHHGWDVTPPVAEIVASTRADEREACARVAEKALEGGYLCPYGRDKPGDPTWNHTDQDICPQCKRSAEDSTFSCHDTASGRIAAAIRNRTPSPPAEEKKT